MEVRSSGRERIVLFKESVSSGQFSASLVVVWSGLRFGDNDPVAFIESNVHFKEVRSAINCVGVSVGVRVGVRSGGGVLVPLGVFLFSLEVFNILQRRG